MKNFIRNKKWAILGITVGALGGWAYWYYIGCLSGTCPLQSQWPYTTVYGALVGSVVFGWVDDTIIKNKDKTENEK